MAAKKHLNKGDIIVDFGSGGGILGHIIEDMWSDRPDVPQYFAVDRPEPLAALSLPARVHNSSKKMAVEDFYSHQLVSCADSIALVVIRNVLHELNISETARLFSTLDEHLPKTSEIYVQDMSSLPRAERGKAGWDPNILKRFLGSVGLTAEMFGQISHGGTHWFALTVHPAHSRLAPQIVRDYCASAREEQYGLLLKQFTETTSQLDASGTADLVALQSDISSIAAQLYEYRTSSITKSEQIPNPPLAFLGIPTIKRPFGEMDYAVAAGEPVSSKSGIVAVLSQKDLLDIPGIISSARQFIFFAGYSQRSLFKDEKNSDALTRAVGHGAAIRVLLSDPNSPAAALRSTEPAYPAPDLLIHDIKETVELGQRFAEGLRGKTSETGLAGGFEMRLSRRVPPCSYFIADDLCYVSLYSLRLTGSRGPCLVLKESRSTLNSYYYILKQDFLYSFDEALQVTLSAAQNEKRN